MLNDERADGGKEFYHISLRFHGDFVAKAEGQFASY